MRRIFSRAQPTIAPLRALIVDAGEEGLQYQYSCREGGTISALAAFRKSVQTAEIRTLTSRLSQVFAHWARATRNDSDTELKHLGGKLYNLLIPRELSEVFRRN